MLYSNLFTYLLLIERQLYMCKACIKYFVFRPRILIRMLYSSECLKFIFQKAEIIILSTKSLTI